MQLLAADQQARPSASARPPGQLAIQSLAADQQARPPASACPRVPPLER